MGGVGALVGLTGAAVVVLDIVIILADDAAHLLVVLALIGAFHALEIRHVRAPGVEAGTGAVDAGLGVVACAGRPDGVDDAAVVGQHLILHRLHRLADSRPGRGRDVLHGGVDESVGRGAVLLMVLEVGVDGHGLGLPRLLRGAGVDIAADGAKLGIGDAHQAVHEVQRHVPAQALALDVQIGQCDLIFGAEEPAQTIFLFLRDKGGVCTANGGGTGCGILGERRRDSHTQHHSCQHQRRQTARETQTLLHGHFLLWFLDLFIVVISVTHCAPDGKDGSCAKM